MRGEIILIMESMTSKGRILVMDDEEYIRVLLTRTLSVFGFKVHASKHGLEAIELFNLAQKAGRPFDALIMDLHIKNGMGGVETLSRLLEIDPEVKAVVSSADTNHPAMINHKAFGFKGFLPKPYSFKELKQEVHSLLLKTE
jgi:two-component system, cell cycle sensor histidine kinase and response regulator CckA